MKTSATQFKILVNFMDKHGDLNKPSRTAKGRIQAIQNWDNLTNLLNSDAAGEPKTTDKWKKVWSDLKNNTKKKAAKINRAASGTGGGPALHMRLTELEERVLNIIGPQAAMGLAGVVEAGFSQVQTQNNPSGTDDRTATFSFSPQHNQNIEESPSILTVPEIELNQVIVTDDWNIPGPSWQVPPPPPSPPAPALASPPRETSVPLSPPRHPATPPSAAAELPCSPYRPAHRGHTPRRRRRRGGPLSHARSPRRRLVGSPSHIEEATHHFLNADEEWRNFLKRKHINEMELQKERLRIRQLEIAAQQTWQAIANSAITTLAALINSKISKD